MWGGEGQGDSSEADDFYIQSVLNKTWHNSQGKEGLGICTEFPIFGIADFKIKGCFYSKGSIRGKWKNYFQGHYLMERELIQCPFNFT